MQTANNITYQHKKTMRGALFIPKKLIRKTVHIEKRLVKRLCKMKKTKLFACALCICFLFTFILLYHQSRKSDFILNNYDDETLQHMLPIDTATDKDYYITRPNGKDDGGVVRVMFTIFSTNIDQTLCYAVASAYFSNIPLVVVGYKTRKYHHIKRHFQWLETLLAAGLNESDVVVALDSDIMFTGLDYLPFVDKFIKLSPANLNELDAKAVRTGEALAPIISGSEWGCWSPETYGNTHKNCMLRFNEAELSHMLYEQQLDNINGTKPFFDYYDNYLKYENGGTSIQRVWAMSELNSAITKLVETEKTVHGNKKWSCDQSILTKLYLELRLWEVEFDYFRKSRNELLNATNTYGMHAGLYSLDIKNEFSSNLWEVHITIFMLTNELWRTSEQDEVTYSHPYSPNIHSYIENEYNKSNKQKLFTKRQLNRSYSNVHSVTIAPPLLSIRPRHINGKDKPAERVYPWLTHYSGSSKEPREAIALNYMQWFLPMMFDKEEWKRGKQYAMSMPIELWTGNDEKLRLRYGDVCEKHPFNRIRYPLLKEYKIYKDKPFWYY